MAPQLGSGIFRINNSGGGFAYAISNNNDREVWALHSTWVSPPHPGGTSTLEVHPIDPAPVPVDVPAMCAYLTGKGENPNDFVIRDHRITTEHCPGGQAQA